MTTCDYCGREYTEETVSCAGCGKILRATGDSVKPKSKAVAVTLAILFGPLGLLYLGAEGAVMLLLVAGTSIFLLPALYETGLGLLFVLLARVACVWWALSVIHRRNNENGNAALAEALLDEATALENEDLAQAAAKYEEVVAQYPNTASGKLARSCLRTLKSNKI